MCIVFIQPCKGFRTKKFRNNGRSVYVTAGKCLKTEPVSELGRPGFPAEENVLMTDSMHAFPVYSGLVRCNHTRKERVGIILIAYALRAFVYA